MDNNDLKKWLAEQISYLEKTKEQPEKFAWDPEYDLQLAAFRLAIEALHGTCNHFREVTKMVPLTLEQLQEMNGEPVWITSVKKDGKIPSRWVLYSGKSESQEREDVYVFATTGGIAQGYKGAAYGKTWLVYDYPPAHIDREEWTAEWIYPGNEWNLPVCSKCGCNSKDATYGHKDNFCPKCGRAMTPEARAELEKRLRG